MSGHSKWATTHRHKAAIDAKRGAIFTKLGNAITIAARAGGSDPEANFQLRLAVDKARAANMPKDNIERAIKRGAGSNDGSIQLEEIVYEIIGPAGVGFIVETITDNRNRTVGTIKALANKAGGQLSGPNSVAWMFERRGFLTLGRVHLSDDELQLSAIDAGAIDIEHDDGVWQVVTSPHDLQSVRQKLQQQNIEVDSAELRYSATTSQTISEPHVREQIERLYDALDSDDDVTTIYTNANW